VSKKSSIPKEEKCAAKGSESSREEAGGKEKVGGRRKRSREMRMVGRKE